jgi:hypothetical protein
LSDLLPSTEVSSVTSIALTSAEFHRLTELEAVVERGMKTVVEVGTALLEIKDRRLYREKFTTFEVYCHERWGFGAHRAYQLMDASVVVQDLSTRVDIPPATEGQTRPLVNLDPVQREKVWTVAVEKHGPNPTVKQVKQVKQEIIGRTPTAKEFNSAMDRTCLAADLGEEPDWSVTLDREEEKRLRQIKSWPSSTRWADFMDHFGPDGEIERYLLIVAKFGGLDAFADGWTVQDMNGSVLAIQSTIGHLEEWVGLMEKKIEEQIQ